MASENIRNATQLIRSANKIVVYTGAGMSKDSGIDVFRGAGNSGFWSGLFGKFALVYGGTPLGWKLTPRYVWSYFITTFLAPIALAKPHAGHLALKSISDLLEKDMDVITMNVDGLHQASGFREGSVCEVHGTLKRFRCILCATPIDIPDPMNEKENPPTCARCNGYPRPDVTLFTEGLPGDAWSKASSLVTSLDKDDVMLMIGTSSVVYPAASLPESALHRGAKLIEINPDDSTPFSHVADIYLKGTAATIVPALLNELQSERRSSRS